MNHISSSNLESNSKPDIKSELPPIFKTWNQIYTVLLVWQAFLMIAFYGFMQFFS